MRAYLRTGLVGLFLAPPISLNLGSKLHLPLALLAVIALPVIAAVAAWR